LPDRLADRTDQALVVRFLETIDNDTPPVDTVIGGSPDGGPPGCDPQQ
jgi:hypothetical protein